MDVNTSIQVCVHRHAYKHMSVYVYVYQQVHMSDCMHTMSTHIDTARKTPCVPVDHQCRRTVARCPLVRDHGHRPRRKATAQRTNVSHHTHPRIFPCWRRRDHVHCPRAAISIQTQTARPCTCVCTICVGERMHTHTTTRMIFEFRQANHVRNAPQGHEAISSSHRDTRRHTETHRHEAVHIDTHMHTHSHSRCYLYYIHAAQSITGNKNAP